MRPKFVYGRAQIALRGLQNGAKPIMYKTRPSEYPCSTISRFCFLSPTQLAHVTLLCRYRSSARLSCQFGLDGSPADVGSGRMPSASSRLRASSSAHVWILWIASQLRWNRGHLLGMVYICCDSKAFTPLCLSMSHNSPLVHRPICAALCSSWSLHQQRKNKDNSRSIGLVCISYRGESKASPYPKNPQFLPALRLPLLTWWDAEQPSGWRVVMRISAPDDS